MTQSDKDPFWQPPKDYSTLPDFNNHFERLIQQQQDQQSVYHNSMRYDRSSNSWKRFPSHTTDQIKLRDFLKDLEDNNEDCYDELQYKEWCEVYEALKDSITENDTVKKLLDITEEMERWKYKYPTYAQHYWKDTYGKNK